MKKKILFVTQQLDCGGVEKALVNLLKLIDRKEYDCELLVIDNKGEFCGFFPEWVKINEYKCPHYVKMMANYYRKPQIHKDDPWHIKTSKMLWSFIHYINKISTKTIKKNISYRCIFEKYKSMNDYSDYDMIIDFHGYGVYTTYLVANTKTRAKKVSWIHEQTIYDAYDFISCVYRKFQYIFGCSKECCNNFIKKFPECSNNVQTYYNYLENQDIMNKATMVENDLYQTDGFKIVSVGRVGEQKSFRRAIEVSKLLIKGKYNFKWIIVGDGPELKELKEETKKANLERYLDFKGYSNNPYAFIHQADLYVQTSRAEGFCTTISEAIILGKPVISTKVGGIEEQLDGGKGGIITGHTPQEIAEAIITLMNNRYLLNKYEEYNKSKEMNFDKEIEKLYEIL